MVFRFIYRTIRADFQVLQINNATELINYNLNYNKLSYDFILIPTYNAFPQVTPQNMREYLYNRGWLYIGNNLPTVYEAADIERICRVGNKNEQQMYYNRQGEFSLVEENTKKIIRDCKINPDSYYF